MNMLRSLLRSVFIAVSMATVSFADQAMITASANAYLRSDQGNTVQSVATDLWIGSVSNTTFMHGLLTFDLSAIPASATITSVTLTMLQDVDDASSTAATITLGLYQLTQSYTQSQVTWNSRATSTPWTTAGGTFNPTQLSSTSVAVRALSGGGTASLAWGTTSGFVSAVQSSYNSGAVISFLLENPNESSQVARELVKLSSASGGSAPKLTIDYTVAAIPEPSAIALLMGTVTLAGGVWLRRRSC